MTTSTISTFLILLALLIHFTNAAIFDIRNDCSYTVWAAAVPGGGRQLNPGQIWSLNVTSPSTSSSTPRIWPRTNCTFDESGQGKCQTGDCNGLLECKVFGTPPNSVAEYALDLSDSYDFLDLSLVEGFNVPIEFSPNSDGCTQGSRCIGDINGDCPEVLRTPGGCNSACTVLKTDEYCCNSASSNCGPNDYSRFFKTRCPDAYSYPKEDPDSTFTCPTGTNYRVVFCPQDEDAVQIADKSPDMCSRTMVLRSMTNFGSVSLC